MFVAIIFALIIVASIVFHFWSPWWWTPVASNWGNIDDTIILTFWVTGAVFVAVCLFMSYCVWEYRYRPERKAEYKPEDKKLEFRLTWLTALGVVALLAPGLVVWNKYISVPKIESIQPLKNFLEKFPNNGSLIFCDINSDKSDLKNILTKKNQGPICILVGPEGDFSEKERQLIIEKKEIFSLSLANNILRAETAAIASVTIVNYHLNLN